LLGVDRGIQSWLHINSVTENVDEATVASLITAIFWPGLTRTISEKLLGIMGDVVMLAVGFVPIWKWQ
jgi:hypothetical protein